MSKMKDAERIAKVISINKDSTNLIFIDEQNTTHEVARQLGELLSERHGIDFGAIVLVRGNPNDVVKLVSAKDLVENISDDIITS